MDPLYHLRDVVKAYGSGGGRVSAVDGIDLVIERGEFVVVAGPSGSGKTTLLQLLGALDRPTSGSVVFEGTDLATVGDRGLARLRRDRLGFVFQQFNLIPTLTALQNVQAADERQPRPRAGAARARRARRARRPPALAAVGRRAAARGDRPRARQRADVLLADEPTGNLDTATGEEIVALLRGLWEDGLSLVLITHDPAVAGTAPRVVHLRDGRVQEGVDDPVHDPRAGGRRRAQPFARRASQRCAPPRSRPTRSSWPPTGARRSTGWPTARRRRRRARRRDAATSTGSRCAAACGTRAIARRC